MTLHPVSPISINEFAAIANESDDDLSNVSLTDADNATVKKVHDDYHNDQPINTNSDQLADQVLSLPREFRPICLLSRSFNRPKNDESKAG